MRIISVFSVFFLLLFFSLPAFAGFECQTCEENCAEIGVEPGERICVMVGDGDPATTVEIDESDLQTAPSAVEQVLRGDEPFQLGVVQWEFFPVVEARSSTGGVSVVDAQRTLTADASGMASCFSPQGYPGTGYVDVVMHLGYNGVPQAINGSPVNLSPTQARCILRRGWSYDFPRMAESADQPSKIEYRVEFVAQRRGMPTERRGPQFLLERVTLSEASATPEVTTQLFRELTTLQRCARLAIEDLPQDLIVTTVEMEWTRQEDQLVPADVDITVTNQTGTERVSQETLDCFQDSLLRTDLELNDLEADKLDATFFLTIRPEGWIDPQ